MDGEKFDEGKPDWSLLPFDVMSWVIKVLTYGKQKYSRDNWQLVPDAKRRYLAAALRHIASNQSGEYLDAESKLPHTAHAICCLIFHLWFEIYDSNFSERKTTPDQNTKRERGDDQKLPISEKVYKSPKLNRLNIRSGTSHQAKRWAQHVYAEGQSGKGHKQ